MPPHFQSSTLAVTEGSFVEAFPFVARRRRQCDVLVFERAQQATDGTTPVVLFLLKNPHGGSKSLGQKWEYWNRIKLAILRRPTTRIAFADISKNGFNDVIIVEGIDPLRSMRISWLENSGDYAAGWKRREIGRCSNIRSIQAGHFTNTFSLQVLAMQDATGLSPLVMFTQPLNVTEVRQPWPSSLVSTEVQGVIADMCVIRPGNAYGELDKILIATENSISLAWWEFGKWHTRNLASIPKPWLKPSMSTVPKGLMCVGSPRKFGVPEFILCAHPLYPSKLSIYTFSTRGSGAEHPHWDHHLLDDFSPSVIVNLKSIELDGTSGFIVLLASGNQYSNSLDEEQTLYFYYPSGQSKTGFDKLLFGGGGIMDYTVGAFESVEKSDIITLKPSPFRAGGTKRQNELTLHSMFAPLIQASIDPSRSNCLMLTVPEPSTIGENKHVLTLFSTFSKTFSLVLLGPEQTYELPSFSAVKVLRGTVESKHQFYRTVRRPCLLLSPNTSTQSLTVKSSSIKAGLRGAILILLVEEENSARDLHINSFSPSILRWEEVPNRTEFDGNKIYTLDAFRLRLVQGLDIAHVHFTALQSPRSSVPILIRGPDPPYSKELSSSRAVCQVRCCIRNASGRGGIYHGDRIFGQARTLPSSSESKPLWHVDNENEPVFVGEAVSYPPVYGWLSDVEGMLKNDFLSRTVGAGQQQQQLELQDDISFDVWMDVDFSPWSFNAEDLGPSDDEALDADILGNRTLLIIMAFCGFLGALFGILIRQCYLLA